MSSEDLLTIINDGNIVEAINGTDWKGLLWFFVYYKRAKNDWILIYPSNEAVPDPFKLNFKGRYYPIPADGIDCESYRIVYNPKKQEKTKKNSEINILSFV